ncbi:hypothetical protein SARC_01976 [Sphaeroforma arctica JP610]|uniref:Uncharacterized protein n=1 Tax=Sphaeroforma arctica JP610 TaxID=667725 RepID=A0A0L0GA02_9EUKA|nr:hypothetical protein SARC_01976 [Sphaeroforma arctica JP610]KNC85867.1 hypothetical protein SARC_01976 [Sphaeroforma arctica JP610]|eukprot:XP_014159769.1 hypothetical protein SARC_01976 [Sphaeroforma arctica JP610]
MPNGVKNLNRGARYTQTLETGVILSRSAKTKPIQGMGNTEHIATDTQEGVRHTHGRPIDLNSKQPRNPEKATTAGMGMGHSH